MKTYWSSLEKKDVTPMHKSNLQNFIHVQYTVLPKFVLEASNLQKNSSTQLRFMYNQKFKLDKQLQLYVYEYSTLVFSLFTI